MKKHIVKHYAWMLSFLALLDLSNITETMGSHLIRGNLNLKTQSLIGAHGSQFNYDADYERRRLALMALGVFQILIQISTY